MLCDTHKVSRIETGYPRKLEDFLKINRSGIPFLEKIITV